MTNCPELSTSKATGAESANRTLHPDAAREPLLLKQTLPADWNGLMQLELTGAAAFWTPTGGVPIVLSETVFTNAQLPQTIYLEGDGCGMGEASFAVVGLSDCVTNTPLQIFGANATLAGVAEADEESPGGFIADRTVHTNAPRTMLTLEACGPYGSPGNLILTWDSSVVKIYTAPSGGTALTQFVTPFHGFNGTNLYVEGIAPGTTTLNWTYSAQTNCTDNIQVSVIKVESILPNIGQEVDDGDGNNQTKVFVISVTNTSDVTVTATLNPLMVESALPSGWTINGGQGSGKLQRTCSTDSASKTEFTFTCDGTDSGLKTTIYVYDTQLGLYADEGNAAQDKYGHSWWKFTADSDIEDLVRSLNPDVDDNKYFGVAGWWPNTQHPDAKFDPVHDWCTEAPGEVRFGTRGSGGHTATGFKVWDIGFDDLVGGVTYVHDLETSGQDWTVLWDNCTDEAIIVGNEAGVDTISYHGITSPADLSDWLNAN